MIKSFRHKGLERFFTQGDRRLLDARQITRIQILLDALDEAKSVEDLRFPGAGLHRLTGNRKDTWSVKVTANLRFTFRFESGNAFDVNLEDYH